METSKFHHNFGQNKLVFRQNEIKVLDGISKEKWKLRMTSSAFHPSTFPWLVSLGVNLLITIYTLVIHLSIYIHPIPSHPIHHLHYTIRRRTPYSHTIYICVCRSRSKKRWLLPNYNKVKVIKYYSYIEPQSF